MSFAAIHTLHMNHNEWVAPYDLHRYLGVHRTDEGASSAYTFRYFDPEAHAVFLVAGFLSWEIGKRMSRTADGVWEITLTPETSLEGECYKYRVLTEDGVCYRSDPFSFCEEGRGGFASVVATGIPMPRFPVWERFREKEERPRHLLELSLASFLTRHARLPFEKGASLSYRELSSPLAIYTKNTSFTHVKLLYPSRGISGSFHAPDPRHGKAEDFFGMAHSLHRSGVGLLLTFPYPKDMYESALLLSASDYYLDSGALDGIAFEPSGEKDPLALSYLIEGLSVLQKRYPFTVFSVDASADVPVDEPEGIGDRVFVRDRKREDVLCRYLSLPFSERAAALTDLIGALLQQGSMASQSFSFTRGGEHSLMEMFYGDYEQKFSESRLYHMLLMAACGEKLSFVLQSLAPFRPWQDGLLPEWYMADFKLHRAHRRFVRTLNRLYLTEPFLWHGDTQRETVFTDTENGVFALLLSRERRAVMIFNTSDRLLSDYTLPLGEGRYTELFSSDEESFAGEGYVNRLTLKAEQNGISLTLAPLTALILLIEE